MHPTAAWLVGLIFPVNYFGGVGHPQLEFWGVRTSTTPTVAAPLLMIIVILAVSTVKQQINRHRLLLCRFEASKEVSK